MGLILYWSNKMMRLWTLIALLSSAIAADDSDYRQQILQAHIVAPAGQPVPFAQVARFPLCSDVELSACCRTQDQVSVNRRRDAGRDSSVVLVSVLGLVQQDCPFL